MNTIVYKIADKPEEFRQIHALNYSTFVEEIPQHAFNADRMLIDKFNDENTYIIALNDSGEIAGMICVRDNRPFSLDAKIPNLDSYLPPHNKICEIRLLSVKKEYRNTKVFAELIKRMFQYTIDNHIDFAVISGTERQVKLYKNLGFEIFADAVGTKDALYYPMYVGNNRFKENSIV